jgi:hypothetical protein
MSIELRLLLLFRDWKDVPDSLELESNLDCEVLDYEVEEY